MRKVQIITDSAVDLPQELIEKHNIYVVPYYISFGEQSYRDGIDINVEQLYKQVKQTNVLPKTAAISPIDWKLHFDKFIEQDMDIVCITISSKISSTYQNAVLSSRDYDKGRVNVIDSKTLSGSIGLLTLKAVGFKEKGYSATEIADKIITLREKMHTQFVLKTLEYLHKGGRCSALTRLFSVVLNIKPQIKIFDGALDVYKKTPGKFSRSVQTMTNEFIDMAKADKLDLEYVFITHSISPKMVKLIKKMLNDANIKVENLIVSSAGCVISSHCGEGTIGILYLEK